MSGTLAYNMRPQSLLDILGQKHIIGENGLFTKFVEKNHPMAHQVVVKQLLQWLWLMI